MSLIKLAQKVSNYLRHIPGFKSNCTLCRPREEPEELLEVLTVTASENLQFQLLILVCLNLFPLLSKFGIFLEKTLAIK